MLSSLQFESGATHHSSVQEYTLIDLIAHMQHHNPWRPLFSTLGFFSPDGECYAAAS